MGRNLANYRNRRALLPAFVLTYATIAILALLLRGVELFPFFNWSLFSNASNPSRDTVLIVHSMNGEVFPKATLFYSLPDRFGAAKNRTTRFAKALDRWAVAVVRKDEATAAKLRNVVETTFMAEAKVARYDLAIIVFDPIERYRSGKIEKTYVLGSYEKH